MACINPDGTLTPTASLLLKTAAQSLSIEEIAHITGLPLYRVRSSLRELVADGFLEEENGKFQLTEKGKQQLG